MDVLRQYFHCCYLVLCCCQSYPNFKDSRLMKFLSRPEVDFVSVTESSNITELITKSR